MWAELCACRGRVWHFENVCVLPIVYNPEHIIQNRAWRKSLYSKMSEGKRGESLLYTDVENSPETNLKEGQGREVRKAKWRQRRAPTCGGGLTIVHDSRRNPHNVNVQFRHGRLYGGASVLVETSSAAVGLAGWRQRCLQHTSM